MASFYDRLKWITGNKLYTVDEHLWPKNVLAMLRSVGFHELLEMRPQSAMIGAESNLRVLKFISGERAEGEEFGRLQEALVNFLPEDEREFLLYAEPYSGMLEAALNAYMWAYPPKYAADECPVMPRWWMTGAIDTEKKAVTVAVYDQGASIPATLPHSEHWNKIKTRMVSLAARAGLTAPPGDPVYDGTGIRLAMALAKSKSGLPQHGKGLHTILEVAQRARSGRLRIISRNGEYVWETGKKSFSRNLSCSIGGTLVEWRLHL